MAAYYDLDDVDTFTVGTIGPPGRRTFFLQIRAGRQRLNLKCEKQQAAALGDYLGRLLVDLPAVSDRPLPGTAELAGELESVFTLGPIGLAYDRELDRIIVVLEEFLPAADEDDDEADEADRGKVRFRVTRSQAEAFGQRASELVSAGRPACIFCGLPMDPDGHPCPRMN